MMNIEDRFKTFLSNILKAYKKGDRERARVIYESEKQEFLSRFEKEMKEENLYPQWKFLEEWIFFDENNYASDYPEIAPTEEDIQELERYLNKKEN